jgi:hypothetical protein
MALLTDWFPCSVGISDHPDLAGEVHFTGENPNFDTSLKKLGSITKGFSYFLQK